MAAKTMREKARSAPRWVVKRTPQAARSAGIVQAPRPMIGIRIASIEAPARPSRLCGGAEVADIQDGSSGE